MSDMTEQKPVQPRSISKRDAVSKLKARIREINVEISHLRARQQGLEKALAILQGESP